MKLQDQEAPVSVVAFPRQPMQNISEKGIFKSPPLRSSHFTCYQKHRTMNRRANKHYPLTCQACNRADTSDRWVCTFCSLQICDPCTRKLQGSFQRDLSRLVEGLAHSMTPDPYSVPPSRLGMRLE
ncbi:hypothetical protein ESCO_005984 [Escovopsis weberi]|uniref:Uncharacterized protein n=1 Tax=Escovopsis weberi TaxID=150374 RepID=A0A0M8N092_ESCWE|nr:hypothetical protein ESCO_005984 [Escovopsis weberi]